MKKLEEGSAEEEAKESPAEEKKEIESGSEDSSEGVTVPEEFQKSVHALISKCDDKPCLNYLRDAVYAKEDELRKAAMKKESKGKGKEYPNEFSTADMPA